eukprot:TRINITY_DN5508_c0_g1_i1.p1 TRINITY_DN5508_c0_g1~~TRINITY_DN5508_c0_g1_i1.p1  ORF type:complete len:308 (-),score=52.51 TRINITY_DN5508_c0_g1_i1:26-949(-)
MLISKDNKFILKTATKEERDFLWSCLPYYFKYIKAHPNTLLTRIYGVYSMKHAGIGGVTRFIIINNIFNSSVFYDPIEKYDLKGSKEGRFVPEHKRATLTTLKDLDIQRKLWIPPSLIDTLKDQIVKDANFLAERRVMDYSLLVGIHYETEENQYDLQKRKQKTKKTETKSPTNVFQTYYGGMVTYNPEKKRKEVYFFGIIDILQKYGKRKQLESFVKSLAVKVEELSAVEPSFYAERFQKFLNNELIAASPMEAQEEEKDELTTEEDSENVSEEKKVTSKRRSKSKKKMDSNRNESSSQDSDTQEL